MSRHRFFNIPDCAQANTNVEGGDLSRSIFRSLMFAVVIFGSMLYLGSASAADKYRAFYYSAQGELLQVEQVPDSEVPNRTLQNPDASQIPVLTKDTHEKISGTNIPMSRLATFAIYYTYDAWPGVEPTIGTQGVRAHPVKIEDLQFVQNRTIGVCLARSGDTPCAYPLRCHCQTGSCCCY
jgi:hypothetical protein